MAQSSNWSMGDVARLKEFHAIHFPSQSIPSLSPSANSSRGTPNAGSLTIGDDDDDDSLGLYHDGVKRTLTDDQIKMFRHSEIQRLLSERRQVRQAAEEDQKHAERREEDMARKRTFYDDVPEQQDRVQGLSYDDPPQQDGTTAHENKFLWPKLGG